MLSKEIWDIMSRETQEVVEGDNLLEEVLNKSIFVSFITWALPAQWMMQSVPIKFLFKLRE